MTEHLNDLFRCMTRTGHIALVIGLRNSKLKFINLDYREEDPCE